MRINMSFIYSWWYAVIVIFVGISANGIIVAKGKVVIGIALILMQILWFIIFIKNKNNE